MDMLKATLMVVCVDLDIMQAEGTSSLAMRATEIMSRARQLERDALCAAVNRAFMIAHSHYGASINLEAMSQGYVLGYED